MGTYYKFDESTPRQGQKTCAFRTEKDLKEFLEIVGIPKHNTLSVYRIEGDVIADDGGPDGLTVLVKKANKAYTPKPNQ